MTARLYLDEDISALVARLLREGGYDAVAASELGAYSETDDEQFERANRDGRTFLTFNYRDFNRIAVRYFVEERSHAGIIVAHRQHTRGDVARLVERISRLLDGMPVEAFADNFVVLPRSESR